MKQLIINTKALALIIAIIATSTYTMEKNITSPASPAQKIPTETITVSKRDTTKQERFDDIEAIHTSVQEFEAQFGHNTESLADQFIKHEITVEDLIHDFVNVYDKNPTIINDYITDEMNVTINSSAAQFVDQLKVDHNYHSLIKELNHYIESIVAQSSMPKTGILLIATELALHKAIKKIISTSFADEKVVKALHKSINKVTITIVGETINAYCSDKEKAKKLKAIAKKIIKPKKIPTVNGETVAKIALKRASKL